MYHKFYMNKQNPISQPLRITAKIHYSVYLFSKLYAYNAIFTCKF